MEARLPRWKTYHALNAANPLEYLRLVKHLRLESLFHKALQWRCAHYRAEWQHSPDLITDVRHFENPDDDERWQLPVEEGAGLYRSLALMIMERF